MEPTSLQTIWYLLFGVLITGYAILDGFDLGVGVLSLFGRKGRDRRLYLNAIGPVWDGNEVWLLTAGGALFAAFPVVYATVFSAFYLALMLLLVALIFRAVSLEFRSRIESEAWQSFWDWGFGLGSLLPAVLFGVAVGNILRGIPIDSQGVFTGSFLGLLNPYAIVVGLLSLAMFTTHGALYLAIKTDGEVQKQAVRWATPAWMAWTVLYVGATLYTFLISPWLFEGLPGHPIFWISILLALGGLLIVPVSVRDRRYARGFVASSVAMAAMIALAALSLYPRLVPSLTDLAHSLTVVNASSTPRTLTTMLIIALVGMPIVIAYTIAIYRIFRGKVELGPESY